MIDIKFLRANPEIVKQNIKNKFQESKLALVDEVIALDEENRKNGDGHTGTSDLCKMGELLKSHCITNPLKSQARERKSLPIPKSFFRVSFTKKGHPPWGAPSVSVYQ